jgi:hypothetical protein
MNHAFGSPQASEAPQAFASSPVANASIVETRKASSVLGGLAGVNFWRCSDTTNKVSSTNLGPAPEASPSVEPNKITDPAARLRKPLWFNWWQLL